MWPETKRLVAYRPSGFNLDATARAIDAVAECAALWSVRGPLTRTGRGTVLGSDGVRGYLDAVRATGEAGEIEVLSLADGAGPDATVLFYDAFDSAPGLETLWLALPPDAPTRLEALVSLTVGVAQAFCAVSAFIEDPDLVRLTRGRRALERARERMPEGLADDNPLPAVEPVRMTQLLVPDEFDRRRAPEGVWWLNYWAAPLVSSVGVDRVLDADWHTIRRFASGAVLGQATEAYVDTHSPADLGAVDRLLTELDIAELQRRWRW